MVYIRQERLPKLKEYRYSGVDHSLVSRYILKPYWWSKVIELFPLSIAPNMITLSGFGFVIINIITLLYYTPGLDQDCPRWVYASWSIGLFLYQTFDAIDGSQARRTRQSGPLGELFDHGVDAVNTSLEVLLFSAAMKLGQGWYTILVLFASLLTFYVQTWDEYHTKTLTLGLVSGPVEGILTLCIVYAFTAVKGADFWHQSMLASMGMSKGFLPKSIYDLPWIEWYLVYGGMVLVFNTLSSAMNVVKARRSRGEDPTAALVGLSPFFGIWFFITAYLLLNPTVLREHLVPFVLFIGLVNAYSVGQMITAHLTKSAFPMYNVLILPLIFGTLDSVGPWMEQHAGIGWPSALGEDGSKYHVAFVFLCLGLGIGVYGTFVVDVIVAICDYLDIWCLTIKHPYTAETEETSSKKVAYPHEKKGQ